MYPKLTDRQSGFTLLELLIALTLSTLVLTLLALAMQLVVDSWERSTSRLDNRLDQSLMIIQIERALEGAFPFVNVNRKKNKRYILFEGENDKLIWVSTVSPGRQGVLTTWKLEGERSGFSEEYQKGVLLSTSKTYVQDHKLLFEDVDAIQILEGREIQFEYMEILPDKKVKWHDNWSGEKRQSLPRAVRIKLSAPDEGDREYLMFSEIRVYSHPSIRPRRGKI